MALRGPQLLGLDIGTTAVKAARIGRKGEQVTVTGLAQAAIDQPGHEGLPSDKTALAIWRCLHMLREPGGAVVCGLSGPDVAVRTFDFPALPRKQLASAIELEAAQVCPFNLEESTVAHQVLAGPTGRGSRAGPPERTTGILVVAKNTVIAQRRELCERGRTYCMMVDVDGLALLNCLEACNARKPGEKALILNLGGSYTNLAILAEDGLPFVRDIAYGGAAIVSHICQGTGQPREVVVGWLEKTDEERFALPELQPSLKEACATLAERVIETVRYYGTRGSGPSVDRVFLCGGLARVDTIIEIMAGLLGGTVELWDPLSLLPVARAVRKSELAEQGPAFAVALGLAMRSLRDVHD